MDHNNNNNSDVIITTEKSIGLITLNRPKALNALNLEMIKNIYNNLLAWEQDNNIKAVVIRGNGEKGFCAGGDIKSLYTNGKTNPLACMEFFRHEYKLNTLIFNYTKPYIALLHGITMGGGVGVSIHGKYKIASDNLIFAMPETGIGFFPDIGASYFLSRCKNYIGLYLALTGCKINAKEAKYLGFVTEVISNQNYNSSFDKFIADLNQIVDLNQVNLTTLCHPGLELGTLHGNLDLPNINTYFKYNNLAEIFLNLEKDKSHNPWAEKILNILNQKSPASLILTFELVKRGGELSFEQCMCLEYSLAYGFLLHNDLYEGIRAALIDKDNNPKWDNINIYNSQNFDYTKYFIADMADGLYL